MTSFTDRNKQEWHNLGGRTLGDLYHVAQVYALDVLPHMRDDVLDRVPVVGYAGGRPLVKMSLYDIGNLNDWCGDMYGYGFSVYWNGKF